ncbi:hypothetical protein BGX24_003539 [Mortierella sp. AD032]|nr:hypothetical protein BGX24_003539 [Mortierella sp. AD032]
MYQACYAFQALQYVPDNESALQAVLRHSTGVVDGLVKVSAVFKLDLTSIIEGLGRLQESVGGIGGVVTTVYEESGQGVFDSLKGGLSTGQKRPWYPAIKAAHAFAQGGQLKDLRQLIFEVPCRRDPLFQWGICQLLGEIAVNPVWAVATRQQAVTLLGYLLKVDREWGRDESVKAWMLIIATNLSSTSDQTVSAIALALLQDIAQDKGASIQIPYSLKAHLPTPASSHILSKMHNIPTVEYDLHKLRVQRLREAHLPVYIPPMAKANLQARDDDLFPLMEKVQEFLASDRQVMLILGDSGSGKSTFNTHLELVLLQSYTRGGCIPLFINLPAIERPEKDLITEQLKTNNFSEVQIQELKQHRRFVIICDGYDESQLTTNLHTSNLFNRPEQWNVKLVISCRSQYLGQDYRDRFVPQRVGHYNRPTLDFFQEAAIAPFSKKQIQDYVEQYNVLSKEDRATLDYILDTGFVSMGVDYSVRLASAIFEKQEGNPVVQYIPGNDKNSWKVQFFGPDPEIRLLRESSPLTRTGSLFRFLHRSMLEYFLSRAVYDPSSHVDSREFPLHPNPDASVAQSPNLRGPLFTRSLLTESSIIQFLCERVKQGSDFEGQLLAVIEQSKIDPTAATAAANAITILVRAGVRFNGADLRGIRIPGADLSDSQLDSAKLQGADLTDVTFAGSWMRQADLSGAQMNGVRFGELPFLNEAYNVCAYSPDGKLLALGNRPGGINIHNITAWNKPYHPTFTLNSMMITCAAFSPNNQQLVYGRKDGFVGLWDISSNRQLIYEQNDGVEGARDFPNKRQRVFGRKRGFKGHCDFSNMVVRNKHEHTKCVKSVTFSPCGKQFASASDDMTVRLWSSVTAECVFTLKDFIGVVTSLAYCADGKRLVSDSNEDGKIRVWDSNTGELVGCWEIPHKTHSPLAFSADGQLVAVPLRGKIQITNALTGEPGPVLNYRSQVKCIAISSNGQWIVTSGSHDKTLLLWDTSSGRPISSFSGHAHLIYTCSFSPSDSHIVSMDEKNCVRLWEMDTRRAILDLDRATHSVYTIAYSPDGQSILSGSFGQGIQHWDSQTGVSAPLSLKMADKFSSFSLSPDGNQIATGHKDGTIRLWGRQADTVESTLLGHTFNVTQLAYSPCGRWVVSVSWSEARLWDLHTNKHPGVITQMDKLFKSCVSFTSTSQFLLSSYYDGIVSLHDPHGQDPRTTLKQISMRSRILSSDCSPDGQELAIGAQNGIVYIWYFQSERPCIELIDHGRKMNADVFSIAYSPCGKWILAGSDDMMVRIWHFRTGEANDWSFAGVVAGCSDTILSLAWNPVVALEFVTGCKDGSVRVWKIASHDDEGGGDVSVQMLWGKDIGHLCISDLTFKGATGLSPINQELLVQRGAVGDGGEAD